MRSRHVCGAFIEFARKIGLGGVSGNRDLIELRGCADQALNAPGDFERAQVFAKPAFMENAQIGVS